MTIQADLERLRNNAYPGRGLGVGLDQTGQNYVLFSFRTGRSPSSRNGAYDRIGERVYTVPVDRSVSIDPLTDYDAMQSTDGQFVVSNGNHTTTIIDEIRRRGRFDDAMRSRDYEPDKIHTPRIAGIVRLGKGGEGAEKWPRAEIGIISRGSKAESVYRFWEYDDLQVLPGVAHLIHTYDHDGNPPPSFSERPYPIPLVGEIESVKSSIWSALDVDNRVCLAVKFIPTNFGKPTVLIENKY